MSISVHCEDCGKAYKVDERFAGKKAKCKACGGSLNIPAAPSASSPAPTFAPPAGAPSAKRKTKTAADGFAPDIDLSSLANLESTGMVDQSAYEPVTRSVLKERNAAMVVAPVEPARMNKGTSYAESLKKKGGKFAARPVDPAAPPEPLSLYSFIPRGVLGWFWTVMVIVGIVGLIIQPIAAICALILLGIGLCLTLYGLTFPGVLARKESAATGLMYRYVPGFQIYFIATRWEETSRCVLALIQGVVLLVLGAGLVGRGDSLRKFIPHFGGDQTAEVDENNSTPTRGGGSAGGAAIPLPDFVDRSSIAKEAVAPGIERQRIHLTGSAPGQTMDLWLYLPTGDHAMASLPCVLTTSAGTPCVAGTDLGDGSHTAETLPYAQAGFAVVVYSMDGTVHGKDFKDLADGLIRFKAADGGLINARNALEYVLAQVPEVDPARIFAAGHSSAGTVALDFAAADPRIRAVAAYAPCCDVSKSLEAAMTSLEQFAPGAREFAQQVSPIQNAGKIKCPIMLFHADDDSVVPRADNANFVNAVLAAHGSISFRTVPTGKHYNSMIQQGIPMGIVFFRAQTKSSPTPTTKPTSKD